MIVRFWGVRGATAVPTATHLRYGGNTCCVAVTGADGELIVLDAGTGFCQLSDALLAGPFGRGEGQLTVLLSQTHWDHLLGFPFAAIVHRPGNRLVVYGPGHADRHIEQIYGMMLAPEYSPFFELSNMGATHEFHEPGPTPFAVGALTITARPIPCAEGYSWGYRVSSGRAAVAYISDARYPGCRPTPEALELACGADLLIHGASTTLAEQQGEQEPCSVEEALALALAADARRLMLSHHAPERSDEAIDALLAYYRARLAEQKHCLTLDAAAEDLVLVL
jgi:phosphoribosyl 1,2-cyclic phosphodiesterase